MAKKLIKLKKFVLFPKFNNRIIYRYSLFKLGDIKSINYFSERLTHFIRKKISLISKEKYAVYATNKKPVSKYCKKNSYILAEKVAEGLGLRLITGEYDYKYDKNTFYDNQSLRRIGATYPPIIRDKNILKKFNYKIIFIDDATVTGNSMVASLKQLSQIADSVSFFTIFAISGRDISEKEINNYAINEKGAEILPKTIDSDRYIFTSHALRTLTELPKQDFSSIINGIDSKKRRNFYKASKIYFGKGFKISN